MLRTMCRALDLVAVLYKHIKFETNGKQLYSKKRFRVKINLNLLSLLKLLSK